ncbi:hypothetical protein PFICI_13905 [Pestalotiopsis fici W106-1]|uniref:Uncharacterized protein n=1 Tax=Pestalotiopsis fici (strain W106-1 / CGMCC3.15140) TaxID=1229662 RepID=W3WJU2_PESFW|nr:uncharacterized protein PFICI_13905 [Pestalotiopsis fici W106-1]ETS74039.1 hypothetical protein PFICI_13905 [Pestalotiopsis fici W106-1]
MISSSFRLSLALALTLSVPSVSADMPLLTAADADAYNAGEYGSLPNQTFHSSDLIAPRLLVTKWERNSTKTGSHIFLSPHIDGQDQAPMILSAGDLSLVYVDPSWNGGADTRMQMYKGDPYLTFWSGTVVRGGGYGGGVLVDRSYQKVANLTTQGFTTLADGHEFQLTHDGGALLVNSHTTTGDCSEVGGGRNCTLKAFAFQEIDIATGEPRFTWRAEDHFSLNESFKAWSGNDSVEWDWFHMNSLEKTMSGDYLISGRYLAMAALINGTTGDKIWQVGGKNSDFRDISTTNGSTGAAAIFEFQHDVRFAGGPRSGSVDNAFDDLTMFDNHVLADGLEQPTPGCIANCSRGLRIRLDHTERTFTLVHDFYHPASVQTFAQGSYQTFPNDNVLVGWGTVPAFTEFTAAGETVLEVQTAPWSSAATGGSLLYRVYKLDWTATPLTNPNAVVVNDTVYVSWNGATEVASWTLFGGQDNERLSKLVTVPRAGFETAIVLDSLPPILKVEAVSTAGETIGSTEVIAS